jgi:hypothetical protein
VVEGSRSREPHSTHLPDHAAGWRQPSPRTRSFPASARSASPPRTGIAAVRFLSDHTDAR